jgi:hypothetical protein
MQSMVDSAPTLSVPIRDTAESAPGWRYLGETYSCIPDAVYPWDPAVVRAIREFCSDAVPISIRSVWKSSRLDGEPRTMVIVRHGLARSIRDPIAPIHHFDCIMPSTPVSGGVRLPKPNYIELNWYDKEVRPWGYDLPGAYLPFDWELHACLRRAYVDSLSPTELVDYLVSPYNARQKIRTKQKKDEEAYVNNDVQTYAAKKIAGMSDVELKEAVLGEPPPPESSPRGDH